MGAPHTREQHRLSWESFRATRNYQRASDATGVTRMTILKWAGSQFICGFACPYHDYEKLLEDEVRAMKLRSEMVNQGNYDPVSHEAAMRADMEKDGRLQRKKAVIMSLVHSDIERIAHWELIYAKIYFDITGIALDYNNIVNPEDMPTKEQILKKGLHINSMKEAIASLALVQAQIDTLKHLTSETRPMAQAVLETEKPSREELRKIKAELETSPERRLTDIRMMIEDPELDAQENNTTQPDAVSEPTNQGTTG